MGKKRKRLAHVVYLGLGSNLGHREKLIAAALNALQRTRGISVETVSGLYETEPVGGPPDQPPFLNAAARLTTDLEPRRLLAVLQQIEAMLGRRRSERWAARTLDLDILLYDDLIYSDEALTIPHPLLHKRRFVLEPLAEIAPDAVHPALQMTVRGLVDSFEGLPPD